ncbi:homocysteine S-methyltransferase family protein [Symbiobacterium thermophilum]|uniref:Methionine synthase n=1 Tax=Symbiobacterium thermophilum TaxID=2734 RepID=A0A953LKV0_SYMTR|nr:homocysteine S-methyltransferase family protein [Symbiobacterium thermophilum]MBY6277432.1 5-methyltetrahydrofolate--homocysteine methyltransferase [Symbiobacterium thermophilum]
MKLEDMLGREVLVFDGAMGTMLQARGLAPGACPDVWNLERPEDVIAVHRAYVEAGAQILETNTFGSTPIRLGHYGLQDRCRDLVVAGVRCAREAAAGRAWVAGSMGPLGALVEPLGELPFDEAYAQFAVQARAFAEAQPDFIIIETIADLNELRAAVLACKDHAPGIRIIAQITLDPSGRAFTGTDPETAALVLQSLGADVIGFNCSVGPDLLVEAVARMARVARVPISVQPNAGLPLLQPDGATRFPMGPEEFAAYGPKLVEAGAALVGGCCGTTPEHIRRLRAAVEGLKPPARPGPLAHTLGLASRTRSLFFVEQNLPVVIGERINPTGRKLLTRDIREGAFQRVRAEAKQQVEAGAAVLDVNVGVPLIDEPAAMARAVRVIQDAVDVPLCLDSPDPAALEAGLKACVGKPLLNSFSLEEGRAEAVLPLARRYGAAVLGLTIDEKGIPASAEQRLAIARRLVAAAEAHGIPRHDVVIDPLALTAGAQQAEAKETLKAIRWITDELGVLASLGVSNISFGLPNRHFLNAVYLSMAVTEGLAMAIMNPLDERMMDTVRALRLFLNRDRNAAVYMQAVGPKRLVHTVEEALKAAAKAGEIAPAAVTPSSGAASGPAPAGGRDGAATPAEPATPAPADLADELGRRLYDAILEGDREAIVPLVEQGLAEGRDPMDMLNRQLIPAIEEVGRLFGEGIYFLPQLMLSAQAMKKAFARLKPEIQKAKVGQTEIGTVVLATVQGDIHDIGKNIVAVLLENYGFRVVDLGRDVKNEVVLEEARKVGADMVGLSALMTTTMPQMKRVIELFAREGFDCPVIVGGAATTKAFAEQIGARGHGRDAQEAVALALEVLKERRAGRKGDAG